MRADEGAHSNHEGGDIIGGAGVPRTGSRPSSARTALDVAYAKARKQQKAVANSGKFFEVDPMTSAWARYVKDTRPVAPSFYTPVTGDAPFRMTDVG